jgi:hypothetical protein
MSWYMVRMLTCSGKTLSVEAKASLLKWSSLLEELLATADNLDGTQPRSDKKAVPLFSAVPYKYDGIPKRDERFKDPYSMGMNPEAMLFDPENQPLPTGP